MVAQTKDRIQVYLEVGKQRVFAGAVDWPGWCRAGKDESAALTSLLQYAPRYARVLRSTRLGFQPPDDVDGFSVIERLQGDSTTDFGAPGKAPRADGKPLGEDDLDRCSKLLKACWSAMDEAVQAAKGKKLKLGPRGGGRGLPEIIRHVVDADAAYLSRIGWKESPAEKNSAADLDQRRKAVLAGLAAAAAGKLPATGPRGGRLWTPRYFVRRVAWHVLDHVWEIIDRLDG